MLISVDLLHILAQPLEINEIKCICCFDCFQAKVKAKDLRGKKKDDLLKQLEEQKQVALYIFHFTKLFLYMKYL